jgi:hypothetical protein
MQAAIDSFKHAWTSAKHAAQSKDEILMFDGAAKQANSQWNSSQQ